MKSAACSLFAAVMLAGHVSAQSVPAGNAATATDPVPAATTGPAPAAAAAAAAPGAGTTTASADESPAYAYDPQGRRDPFVSLLRRGADTGRSAYGSRPAGLSGLETADLALKGIMQSRTGYVAIVEAADKRTYIVKSGDKLLDGTVRLISAEAMVILQQINDPLSLEKQREVRKVLRQTDEVK